MGEAEALWESEASTLPTSGGQAVDKGEMGGAGEGQEVA